MNAVQKYNLVTALHIALFGGIIIGAGITFAESDAPSSEASPVQESAPVDGGEVTPSEDAIVEETSGIVEFIQETLGLSPAEETDASQEPPSEPSLLGEVSPEGTPSEDIASVEETLAPTVDAGETAPSETPGIIESIIEEVIGLFSGEEADSMGGDGASPSAGDGAEEIIDSTQDAEETFPVSLDGAAVSPEEIALDVPLEETPQEEVSLLQEKKEAETEIQPEEAPSLEINYSLFIFFHIIKITNAEPGSTVAIYWLDNPDTAPDASHVYAATIGEDGSVELETSTLFSGEFVLVNTSEEGNCGGMSLSECRAEEHFYGETLLKIGEEPFFLQ